MGVKRLNRLDGEWVKLILEAKKLGLSTQEVKEFFLNQAKQTEKEILVK